MSISGRRPLTALFKLGSFQINLLLLLLGIGIVLTDIAAAQKNELPEGVVPPPLSILSEDEKDSLDATKSLNKRTKLAINLMEARLIRSESFSEKEEFQDSLAQLGHFKAVMNATFKNLNQNDYKKSVSKNYKRFEIALREFIPRLELVRRALPFSHSYHVSKLIKSVRDTRRQSIETFFDDTVIPNGK